MMWKKKLKEAAVGFALGAVGGFIMGVTEDPVDRTLSAMTSASQLKPLIDNIRTVGALGLGTLMGASALTIAMTSVVAGVIMAAVVASVFVTTRSCGTIQTNYANLWASAGLAGALGTTLSGATLGFFIETIVNNSGMFGLLSALSIFSILKPPLRFVFNVLWKQGEACCTQGSIVWDKERKEFEISDLEQRERVAVQIEERILTINNGRNTSGTKDMMTWATERKLREKLERKKTEVEEAQIKQQTLQDWIKTVMVKYVDFLAFSGIPMTVVAVVSSLFGLFGYGRHHYAFIALIALVAVIGYLILKSSDLKFWMLIGCMGMLATFVIAMLTVQAGDEVNKVAMNLRAEQQNVNAKSINDRMIDHCSREALKTAIIAAKLCQLCLGATVGGPLVRHGGEGGKVILGAAIVALGLLAGVEVLSPVLGNGGKAGALLGVVGTSGVSVGAVAAMTGQCSSWPRTLGAIAGLIIGTLATDKLHIVMIGIQVIVAYIFAMNNAF
ncbi:uncharacterized protein LOC133500638 [Syngnathoides biaculeatus]|uniref:uncharacterized protein LOC133500638 n=1 Tax=Syngnathoides biaculeatus TaxID=300417 RepID=UPI002ADDC430|nr:uncharacterized protein LOC133500638 [Syngnathoides biaculeatus]XP_061675588.1 uncharacterized protein LOC133500638 [Syngnathoides biaculeatus]XP_061675589.1 uncharacterized protein LOC133500638 [Syngnathoides biaculeatus]XP_061675590.1 uncharacterized protein LOC133500638 [Syngnathoides biaculeatus]